MVCENLCNVILMYILILVTVSCWNVSNTCTMSLACCYNDKLFLPWIKSYFLNCHAADSSYTSNYALSNDDSFAWILCAPLCIHILLIWYCIMKLSYTMNLSCFYKIVLPQLKKNGWWLLSESRACSIMSNYEWSKIDIRECYVELCAKCHI